MKHHFLFENGIWLGEGKVSFTASHDTVKFFTRWLILDATADTLFCVQDVELHGTDQVLHNKFYFTEITKTHFKVMLENETMGKVSGKGIIDSKTIAWELRDHPGLEGYEVYELQENGEYNFHAEYSSVDHFRTIINGKIWKKR